MNLLNSAFFLPIKRFVISHIKDDFRQSFGGFRHREIGAFRLRLRSFCFRVFCGYNRISSCLLYRRRVEKFKGWIVSVFLRL